ncbi:hypothetical protein chiPu_0021982 [Chiloscyllium punctatum]|uniref:Uncharacterized protein n=1 Tax=Chiloscyllium punctatum TaxID=137246 RepID=A0A401RGL4_CHIPU|nr:hypothetical protein [Chiloscyllium punctatum]
MARQKFRDYAISTFKRLGKDKKKLTEQQEDVQRYLTLTQLDELKIKREKKLLPVTTGLVGADMMSNMLHQEESSNRIDGTCKSVYDVLGLPREPE